MHRCGIGCSPRASFCLVRLDGHVALAGARLEVPHLSVTSTSVWILESEMREHRAWRAALAPA
jgi:hypothetical protein